MKISVGLAWLVLTATIGVTFGLCIKNTKCHECILVRDCVFIRLKNHTLLCAPKDDLFSLKPSSVYKTPRRCNILDKKTTGSQVDSSHNTKKIGDTEELLKLFDKSPKMLLIAAEEKNAAAKNAKLISTTLDFNIDTGNRDFKNLSDQAKYNLVSTPSPLLMNTPTSPTAIKREFEPNHQKQKQMADSGHRQSVSSDLMDAKLYSTVESDHPSEEQLTDSRHRHSVSSDLMATKLHSTVGSDHQSEKEIAGSSQHHSASSDLMGSTLHSTTGVVQSELKYPWILNPTKYDDLKSRIIQACCLLDQLFREFGDLHFLEIDTIKNYHFVGFQIKNPINSRKYLCM